MIKPDKPRDEQTSIKPLCFEGKENCIESHLMQFEIIAKRNQWDDLEKADFLKCTLSGEASHISRDLEESATYDDVITKLRQRYGSLEQIESFRMELKQRKRKPGESLAHLLKDIRRLFMQAYPGPPNYMTQLTAKDAFIDVLDDRELTIKVMEREPNTLDQAFKIAERMELYQKIPKDREQVSKSKPAAKVRGTTTPSDSVLQSVIEMQKVMQKQLTLLTEAWQKDQATASKPGLPTRTPFDKSKVICHACRKPGHFKAECPERSKSTTEMSCRCWSEHTKSVVAKAEKTPDDEKQPGRGVKRGDSRSRTCRVGRRCC